MNYLVTVSSADTKAIDSLADNSTLEMRLRERIMREGPITFRDWMSAALYDPGEGYYCRDRSRWGREGDYRTNPERSQLFAATFARYFATLYANSAARRHWTVFEAGAGEGHFAEGLLDTLQKFFPSVFAATSYVIDEISPHSRSLAAERLKRFGDQVQFKKLDELESFSGIVFSNELLDAFPVHRFIRRDGRLLEFYVNASTSGGFEWILDAPSPKVAERFESYLKDGGHDISDEQTVEVNFEIEEWLGLVAEKLSSGYVVTVDYGSEDSSSARENKNGTLRGFRRHQFVDDLLASPGTCDLTTSVDWRFVKAVGSRVGLEVVDFESLDKFLMSAGLLEHLELLSRDIPSEGERLVMSTAAREMILPNGMASSFQVLVQQKVGQKQ